MKGGKRVKTPKWFKYDTWKIYALSAVYDYMGGEIWTISWLVPEHSLWTCVDFHVRRLGLCLSKYDGREPRKALTPVVRCALFSSSSSAESAASSGVPSKLRQLALTPLSPLQRNLRFLCRLFAGSSPGYDPDFTHCPLFTII